MAVLNVNIDHVATVRQARQADEPDPVWAAVQCELAGANGITVHLRVDRRHISDRDVELLKQTVACKLNLEMSMDQQIVEIAQRLVPDQVTLVPEKRQELTTEGGLDCVVSAKRLEEVASAMREKDILVSAFIAPESDQIKAAADTGCHAVEFHTGMYANARDAQAIDKEVRKLIAGTEIACEQGLVVHAGHGLTYRNIGPIAAIEQLHELNIGHSIVSRSVFEGMAKATEQMIELIDKYSLTDRRI